MPPHSPHTEEVSWRRFATPAQRKAIDAERAAGARVYGFNRIHKPALKIEYAMPSKDGGRASYRDVTYGPRGAVQHDSANEPRKPSRRERERRDLDDDSRDPIVHRGGKMFLRLGS